MVIMSQIVWIADGLGNWLVGWLGRCLRYVLEIWSLGLQLHYKSNDFGKFERKKNKFWKVVTEKFKFKITVKRHNCIKFKK